MSHTRAFKKALARISRLSAANDYDAALKEVESLLETWPGNPQAHVLRASFIQLQGDPGCTLDDAKKTLQEAVELDKTSPAAAIELAHFLDAVEDNPKAAVTVYAEAIVRSRDLLIEALIGQAKALLQLDKKAEALKCLVELLQLMGTASSSDRSKSARAGNGLLKGSMGKDVYSSQIESLLHAVFTL
ncbi:MAG TPA: hypothetical protein VJ783_10570 [Pirellulales bacterium]|nr:hypothetical protein [Pirellulales bacterium]